MTTAEIFVLFYSQEGIKNTLTFVVKVLIILLVSKFTNHGAFLFKTTFKYLYVIKIYLFVMLLDIKVNHLSQGTHYK